MVTKIQLSELLLDLESDKVERTVSTNNTQKFAITICAFANDFSKVTVFEVKEPISSHYLAFTDPVIQLLKLLAQGELSSSEMRARLGIKHRANFRDNYIHPAISLGLIVQTIPEKPNSRLQKYKLTERARKYLSENVIKN